MSTASTTAINGSTAIFGLLGSNVSQSHSMTMHNAAFLKQNRNACYIPLSTTTEHFERAVNGCKSLDFYGLNVTIPYKESISDYVDFTTTLAHQLASINTVKRTGSSYSGANTDILGLWKALQINNTQIADRPVVIIGAGGAARAAVHLVYMANSNITLEQLIEQQLEELKQQRRIPSQKIKTNAKVSVSVINRSERRSHQLVQNAQRSFGSVDIASNPQQIPEDAIVFQCTPLGMQGHYPNIDPIESIKISQQNCVAELITSPCETPLIRRAIAMGCDVMLGKEMLLWQAIYSQQIWREMRPPCQEQLRQAMTNALAASL